eukprot:1741902-Amphidinium_carterae.1
MQHGLPPSSRGPLLLRAEASHFHPATPRVQGQSSSLAVPTLNPLRVHWVALMFVLICIAVQKTVTFGHSVWRRHRTKRHRFSIVPWFSPRSI